MNIDGLGFLASSGENLDTSQLALQGDEVMSQEFSEALMEKLKQFAGSGEADDSSDNGIINLLDTTEKLQGFAGLLSQSGDIEEFSNLLGNNLPTDKQLTNDAQLTKEFDLDDTLEELSKVVSVLDEFAIETKLDALIEKVELLQASVPEKSEKIAEIIEGFKQIDLSTLNQERLEVEKGLGERDLTLDNEELSNQIVENIKPIADLVTKDNTPIESENVTLESQLELLITEIESIKEVSSKKMIEVSDNELVDLKDEEDIVQLTNQITALATSISEPQKSGRVVAESGVVGQVMQEMKSTLKQNDLSELEYSAETEETPDVDILSQRENKFAKSEQETSLTTTKQSGKIEAPTVKEFELSAEKTTAKFSTELAMLNRAVVIENKTEIPPMTKHFSHPEWNKEIGERVIWMHKQEIPSAELRLNPKHLGPITIKVDVTQDQATVAFTAQHAVVKEAIEAALPKLREMLSAQQLNLVDVNVSQNDSGQKQTKDPNQMGNGAGENEREDSNEPSKNEQMDKTMDVADEIEAGRTIASNGILSIFA